MYTVIVLDNSAVARMLETRLTCDVITGTITSLIWRCQVNTDRTHELAGKFRRQKPLVAISDRTVQRSDLGWNVNRGPGTWIIWLGR
jgi:hypothetical protein